MVLASAALAYAFASNPGDRDNYLAEIDRWRESRVASFRAEDSWLTLVGLHWLRDGETALGSDPTADIVLPAASAPRLGTLLLDQGRAQLRLEPGVVATVAGQPFKGGPIRTDAEGKADVVAVGDLRLMVLKRGSRYALRVKDNGSGARDRFHGFNWFPVDPSWRIEGRFTPAEGQSLVFDTIIGEQDVLESPGVVSFERDGQTYQLQAAKEGDHLWFVFRDATSGKSTAGVARQLEAPWPDADGRVVLDFNKAVNLPCSYTPYATCPIAPRQNRLPLAIEAGEKTYKPSE